ncbi:hypothetical protein V5F34_13870 [Xanthobacter autotrophicus]|uniref:hypothetical protein n=1 Tax=Xanthobacter autotrophicus TaxID=280 RepID=UPI00372C86FE
MKFIATPMWQREHGVPVADSMAGSGRKLVLDLQGRICFRVLYLFYFSGDRAKPEESGWPAD